MRFISCHDGKLQTLETAGLKASPDHAFAIGLAAWDELAPQKMFARGAVHELLFDSVAGAPIFVASMLAQAAAGDSLRAGLCESGSSRSDEHAALKTYATASRPGLTDSGSPRCMTVEGNVIRLHESAPILDAPPRLFGQRAQDMPIIWSDPRGEIYPPALAALDFDLATDVPAAHARRRGRGVGGGGVLALPRRRRGRHDAAADPKNVAHRRAAAAARGGARRVSRHPAATDRPRRRRVRRGDAVEGLAAPRRANGSALDDPAASWPRRGVSVNP
jgi:hypothetical protein